MTTSRTLRLLVVSALATLSGLGTPVAHAVSPPPIDERWLPESALPAPPRPTVQREVCTEVTAESGRAFGRAERSAQLADLDQVWRLARGAGQRVAVIDTGVARHRRLPKVVAGGDYVFTGDGTRIAMHTARWWPELSRPHRMRKATISAGWHPMSP